MITILIETYMKNLGYLLVYSKQSNLIFIIKKSKMIKYEHSDAGLSFHNIKIKKLRTF